MKPVVVVTGVLGGIGQAIAEEFQKENYFVVGLDIKAGTSAHCDLYHQFDLFLYATDAAYRSEADEWFDTNVADIKCLVNNAAVQRLGDLEELAIEDWNETMAVNLTGPMLLSKKFAYRLSKSLGAIINIASIHQNLTKKRFIAYATSKSALVGLTKALSVDLQGTVKVNAISPAAIDTEMLREGFDHNEEMISRLHALHPSQRIGRPAEVAKLCVLLTQNHFDFLNGTNIEMDGGISNVLKDLD